MDARERGAPAARSGSSRRAADGTGGATGSATIRRRGLAVALAAAVALLTGLSPAEVDARRDGGESTLDIARSRGVDPALVRRVLDATARPQLEAAVAAGDLTAEEARSVLVRLDADAGAFRQERTRAAGGGRVGADDGPPELR